MHPSVHLVWLPVRQNFAPTFTPAEISLQRIVKGWQPSLYCYVLPQNPFVT